MFKKIKDLLTSPTRWCQGYEALNGDGLKIHPEEKDAKRWCLVGAIRKIYPSVERTNVEERIRQYLGMGVTEWNDDPHTTFEMVHDVILELDV